MGVKRKVCYSSVTKFMCYFFTILLSETVIQKFLSEFKYFFCFKLEILNHTSNKNYKISISLICLRILRKEI